MKKILLLTMTLIIAHSTYPQDTELSITDRAIIGSIGAITVVGSCVATPYLARKATIDNNKVFTFKSTVLTLNTLGISFGGMLCAIAASPTITTTHTAIALGTTSLLYLGMNRISSMQDDNNKIKEHWQRIAPAYKYSLACGAALLPSLLVEYQKGPSTHTMATNSALCLGGSIGAAIIAHQYHNNIMDYLCTPIIKSHTLYSTEKLKKSSCATGNLDPQNNPYIIWNSIRALSSYHPNNANGDVVNEVTLYEYTIDTAYRPTLSPFELVLPYVYATASITSLAYGALVACRATQSQQWSPWRLALLSGALCIGGLYIDNKSIDEKQPYARMAQQKCALVCLGLSATTAIAAIYKKF